MERASQLNGKNKEARSCFSSKQNKILKTQQIKI